MRFLTLSGIGWLLSLAGLCCWLLIVICALRILLPHVWSNLRMIVPSYAPKLLKYAATLGFLGLSFFAGYGYRDHQLTTRRITYTNVLIAEKVADRDFWVVPEYMSKQHIQICPSSIVDWREKEVLSDWTFEQLQGCKRVISYHEKSQGEFNASIQIR